MAEAWRVRSTRHPKVRVITFIFLILLLTSVTLFVTVLSQYAYLLFKAMIVVAGIKLDFSFISKLEGYAHYFSALLYAPWMEKYIFSPCIEALDFLLKFKIDLAFVNITCAGSTSPMKLIFNLLIFGIIVIIVKGKIYLVKAVTLDALTGLFLEVSLKSRYRLWDSAMYQKVFDIVAVETDLSGSSSKEEKMEKEKATVDRISKKLPPKPKYFSANFPANIIYVGGAALVSKLQVFQILTQYFAT